MRIAAQATITSGRKNERRFAWEPCYGKFYGSDEGDLKQLMLSAGIMLTFLPMALNTTRP